MTTTTALDMLRDNESLEKNVKYSHLSKAKILKQAQQSKNKPADSLH